MEKWGNKCAFLSEFQEFSLLFALKVRDTAAKRQNTMRFNKFLYFKGCVGLKNGENIEL